jgi:hypothetical protein
MSNTSESLLFDNAIAYLENNIKDLNETKEKSRVLCENLSSNFCNEIYPRKAALEILRLMKVDLENNDLVRWKCYEYLNANCGSFLFTQTSVELRSLNSYLSKKYYAYLDSLRN